MDIQSILNKKLGPEFISQRPGPGGGGLKLTYIEGWKVINLANQVFGYDGWSSSIVSVTTDFIDHNKDSNRYTVGVSAIVRVTLTQGGAYHEDVGYGTLENSKSKGAALDKCKKEAITDGLKRALRNFGNLLGNCLYDKTYAQQIVKLKVPPFQLDASELYHYRPDDIKVDVKPTRSMSTTEPDLSTSLAASRPVFASAIPPHVRASIHNDNNTGLVTPVKTPDHKSLPPAHAIRQPLQQQNNNSRVQTTHTNANSTVTGPLVSFADTPTTERENSVTTTDDTRHSIDVSSAPADDHEFAFNSDDDAFFADVDLGDADLGRPIDFEEGLGPPIVHEGSSIVGVECKERQAQGVLTSGRIINVGAREVSNGPDGPPARQAPPISLSGASSTKPVQGLTSSSTSTTTSRSTTIVATSGNSNANVYRNGPATSTTNTTTDAMGKSTSTAAAANVGGPQAAGTKRSSIPSMGGFHFPPGMNPFGVQSPSVVSATSSTTTSGGGVTIGVKRPAETLPIRRPTYGMGLAQQQQAQVKREPLARLDVTNDLSNAQAYGAGHGDVKRARR